MTSVIPRRCSRRNGHVHERVHDEAFGPDAGGKTNGAPSGKKSAVTTTPTLPDDTPARLLALLSTHAPFAPAPLVPTLRAPAAVDELPLWQAAELAFGGPLPAPFWAVAWPGAQALARAIVDGVVDVEGRVVVDIGCGCGLAAIAAAKHGAARVTAVDVDPLAVQVALLCADENGAAENGAAENGAAGSSAAIKACVGDPIMGDDDAIADVIASADVVLAGDLVYNVDTGARLVQRARSWRAAGKDVVLADSGRPFFDADGAPVVARHDVAVPFAVEGVTRRTVTVYRHTGAARR
jgi:predicted nicotinamide N-methyase